MIGVKDQGFAFGICDSEDLSSFVSRSASLAR